MRRYVQILAVVAIVSTAVYATRCVRHQRARAVALPVVSELGGRIGSITAPFGGTEYYISFAGCSLSREDIDRLAVLNALARNWNYVSVSLNGASILSGDREYLRQKLLEVHVLPVEASASAKPAA